MQKRIKKLKQQLRKDHSWSKNSARGSNAGLAPPSVSSVDSRSSSEHSPGCSVTSKASGGHGTAGVSCLSLPRRGSRKGKAKARTTAPNYQGNPDPAALPRESRMNLQTEWTIPMKPPSVASSMSSTPRDLTDSRSASVRSTGQRQGATATCAELGIIKGSRPRERDTTVAVVEANSEARPSQAVDAVHLAEQGRSPRASSVTRSCRGPRCGPHIERSVIGMLNVTSFVAGPVIAVLAFAGVFGTGCLDAVNQLAGMITLLGGSLAALLTCARAVFLVFASSLQMPTWQYALVETHCGLFYITLVFGAFVGAQELLKSGVAPAGANTLVIDGSCFTEAAGWLMRLLPICMQLSVGTALCLMLKAGLALTVMPQSPLLNEIEKQANRKHIQGKV